MSENVWFCGALRSHRMRPVVRNPLMAFSIPKRFEFRNALQFLNIEILFFMTCFSELFGFTIISISVVIF